MTQFNALIFAGTDVIIDAAEAEAEHLIDETKTLLYEQGCRRLGIKDRRSVAHEYTYEEYEL
jgi:hypothetical protein